MTRTPLRTCIRRAVRWTLVAAFVPSAAAPATAVAAPLEARVDAYLAPYLETGNFSGAVLIGRGDRVLLAKGFGEASRELGVPATADTVFHVASVSKSFTAAAVLRLEELGKLAVEDPIGKHLPGYPNGDRITVHHLLVHSSGIPNVNAFPEYETWQRLPQTLESMVERFRDRPLEFAPGERYGYSNSNYNLLALLIEKLSGQSYGDFLREQLFVPAGMARTAHHGDFRAVIAGRATGYAPAGRADVERAPAIDWSIKTGNGSLVTTVGDLFRWHRALTEGRVLSDASRRKIFTEHLERVGYGWFLGERWGGREIYINGRSPGFGAFLGRYPDADLAVVVAMNLYSTLPTTIGRDLAALALDEPVAPPRFRSAPPPPELLSEVAGTYRFGEAFYVPNGEVSFFERDGHLFCDWGWLMPQGGLSFRDRTYWTEVEFVRGDDRRIDAVRIDEHTGRRVDPPPAGEGG